MMKTSKQVYSCSTVLTWDHPLALLTDNPPDLCTIFTETTLELQIQASLLTQLCILEKTCQKK